ncbi:hypothetical protein AMD27_10140 [Acinetobacter sp. TGL-Y2]|uniref:putative quinol monooxygenase n=1 Tax=Acinetobacter sp. TGL-Y2 TaxID=1407071 RepID=UPI0007A661F2|nr:putative quinol monooxygenase [Acinetobacter sp. TGL-Y2]AMW79218.1 hypothetical protein AMD27_10140 [Acinetobacter sp. TGL-Y2]
MLTVIAEINLISNTAFKSVLERIQQLIPAVLNEDGCYAYELLSDSELQSPMQTKVPNSLVMYEKWESVEQLEAHMQTPHMLAHTQAIQDQVAEVKIRILENPFSRSSSLTNV